MFNHIQPTAKPNQTLELFGGLGILAAGAIHSIAFPAATPPRTEKPGNAAIVEVDTSSDWGNLNGPRLNSHNPENGSVR